MMMPANYSAVAETEMTYVVGGASVLDGVINLGENLWTIVGNSFVSKFVAATLGTLFGGNYAFGAVTNAFGDAVTGVDTLNTVLQVVGMGAAVHQLATNDVKAYTKEKKFIDFKIV